MGNTASGNAMVPLFDEGLPDLAALVRSNPLLGFDYDGTLAPIVSNPRRALMRDRTAVIFARLVEHFPCAVISGRARADVAALLGDSKPLAIVGNHGIESEDGPPPAAPDDLVSMWRTELDERLETMPGFVIEDKTYSLTIHYRACPDRSAARRLALNACAGLGSARIINGIRSLNLVPEGFPDKGSALLGVADRAGCRSVLFVGDDQTDEDAFGAAPGRVLGIRVGCTAKSAARYCLRDQTEIDALLQQLLALQTRQNH